MKRLICLIKGHDWHRIMRRSNYYTTEGILEVGYTIHICKRCDKKA